MFKKTCYDNITGIIYDNIKNDVESKQFLFLKRAVRIVSYDLIFVKVPTVSCKKANKVGIFLKFQ